MSMPRPTIVALLLLFLFGCAERRLVIETEPPGATVYLDNAPIGTTPLDVEFTYGGLREILILHDVGTEGPEGRVTYKPLLVRQELENFAFDVFPFDVFTSLVPARIEDRHELRFTLEPAEEIPLLRATGDAYIDALTDRAESLAARSRRAFEEGFPAVEPLGANREGESGAKPTEEEPTEDDAPPPPADPTADPETGERP
ncbi:MAG: PEGA domain-containing protein [Planctomycetota bacterium]